MLFLLLFYLTLELILVQSGRKCSQSNCTSSRLLSVTFFPLLPLQPSLPHSPSHTFTEQGRQTHKSGCHGLDSDPTAKSWLTTENRKRGKTSRKEVNISFRQTWDINPLATVVGLWRHCYFTIIPLFLLILISRNPWQFEKMIMPHEWRRPSIINDGILR